MATLLHDRCHASCITVHTHPLDPAKIKTDARIFQYTKNTEVLNVFASDLKCR